MLGINVKNISPYQWVVLSQLFVILPHAAHLPVWLIIYAMVVLVLQSNPVRQKFALHKRQLQLIQMLGFVAGVVGIYMTYKTLFGLDVGVAFLLLCLVSKLFELNSRRDVYIILNLSLFVLAGLFLMDQSIGTTLQVLLGVVAILYALIAQNDDGSGRVRTLLLLSLQAVPLMLVLFIFFPRLPPLWSMQLSGAQAKTGMSDTMSPGDFANLSQSSELAFRVEFAGKMPDKSQLYWRGLVFSQFDGATWQQGQDAQITAWQTTAANVAWLSQHNVFIPQVQVTTIPYTVILEPTQQKWLFALDFPKTTTQDIGLTRAYTLQKAQAVTQRYTYQVSQFNQVIKDISLPVWLQQQTLALPKGNTKSQQFARQLFASNQGNVELYIQQLLGWIRTANFRYTLSPPILADNRIDDFLFNTRAGFCEHYASSFVFLMRAAGVPARVVVGYQGGQLGRDGQSWEVRQMDAHAWAEVWLQGKGWVRVDPTAAIAPDRVERGMNETMQSQGSAIFGEGVAGELSYQQFQMMQRMRRFIDQANYYWQKDIVGYDEDSQKDALLNWFNLKNQMQQILTMLAVFASMVAIIVAVLWWRRRKVWHPVDAPLVKLSTKMTKIGLQRTPQEGMLAWLERIGEATSQQQITQNISKTYRALRYGNQLTVEQHVALLKRMQQQVKQFYLQK